MKSHTSMFGTFFVYTLALCMPIFKKKSSLKRLGKKFQNFHCSNVTTMKSLELFPRRFREDFFLKIGIRGSKVYTKRAREVIEVEVIDAEVIEAVVIEGGSY